MRTVGKQYISTEVVANFIDTLKLTPAQILTAPYDFIVDDFNSRLRSAVDAVAPFKTKVLKTSFKKP